MLAAVLSLGVAHAQEGAGQGFDAHGFQLAPHDGDLRDPLVVPRPGPLVAGDWFASALFEYAKAPLVQGVVPAGGGPEEVVPVIDDLLVANLSTGVAAHERLRLELGAPVYGFSTDATQSLQPPAFGDLRAGVTVLAVSPAHVEGGGGPGLGLFGHVDVPTGPPRRFLGQGRLAGGVGAAGVVELPGTTLTAHVGAQINPAVEGASLAGADRLVAGLAAGFLTSDTVSVTVEGVVQPPLAAVGPDEIRTLPPAEALLSLRAVSARGAFWTAGVAAGITDGPGVAAFRLFVGGGFADRTPPSPIDRDTLGALRASDACPSEVETVNGWRDDDGCPDQLGALSVEALFAGTPRAVEAEVLGPDGRQTLSVPAAGWQVDAVPGASFQVRAWDGCLRGEGSAVVREGGAVLSIALAPVYDARATVEVVGPDDAPLPGASVRWTSARPECVPADELLTDASGAAAGDIAAGTHRLLVTAVGYTVSEQDVQLLPGDDRAIRVALGPSKVVLEREQIRILEKVQFETGKAVIRPESFGLLDEVASVIKDHPDAGRVEVSGHTDDRGSDSLNQRLSEDRAKAVTEYLTARAGVDPARLSAVGYGESRPIDTNRTEAGREANRRVEFTLVDQLDPQETTP